MPFPWCCRSWWKSYYEVNARFAEVCAAEAAPGAVVWIQDYQLQLVPAMLRERRPDLRIGFFLHIPFPPVELFMQLPHRMEILKGLLGADLVGFQRPLAAQNFLSLTRHLLGYRPRGHYVTVEDRVFRLVRENLGRSNVFAFGIGSSVNRHLIEGIARAGQGEPFVVTKPEVAQEQAERLRRIIEAPVLTGVRARFEGLDVFDTEPARLDALPDVLGGRPVAILGKWRGPAQGQLVIDAAGGRRTRNVRILGGPQRPETSLRPAPIERRHRPRSRTSRRAAPHRVGRSAQDISRG